MMNRTTAFILSICLSLSYLAWIGCSHFTFFPSAGYRIRSGTVQEDLLYAGRDRPAAADQTRELLPGESIDINTADSAALQRLPGIGPVLSDAIVQYRESFGLFQEPEDLMNVPGIGGKTFSLVREYITTGGAL